MQRNCPGREVPTSRRRGALRARAPHETLPKARQCRQSQKAMLERPDPLTVIIVIPTFNSAAFLDSARQRFGPVVRELGMHRGRRWVVRRHGQDRDRVRVARSTIPDDANREQRPFGGAEPRIPAHRPAVAIRDLHGQRRRWLPHAIETLTRSQRATRVRSGLTAWPRQLTHQALGSRRIRTRREAGAGLASRAVASSNGRSTGLRTSMSSSTGTSSFRPAWSSRDVTHTTALGRSTHAFGAWRTGTCYPAQPLRRSRVG